MSTIYYFIIFLVCLILFNLGVSSYKENLKTSNDNKNSSTDRSMTIIIGLVLFILLMMIFRNRK